MKKFNLMTLLFGAMLFVGLSSTTLSAEGMKCGAGKCGTSMKVASGKSCDKPDCKYGPDCKCGDKKEGMKCGAKK